MPGSLAGLCIVDMAGPGFFCGMMLADHGVEVIRVDRAASGYGVAGDPAKNFAIRSRSMPVRPPEAPLHPHDAARESFVGVDGRVQPKPAPGCSQTPDAMPRAMAGDGVVSSAILGELGYSASAIDAMFNAGTIA